MSALLIACLLLGQERKTPVVMVVEKAGPAVVSIGAELVDENPFRQGGPFDEGWRGFAAPRERTEGRRSLGSGVIIQSDGIVLTNEHVISRATTITVTLRDRRSFEADVLGADPAFDVAVLKLRNARDLPTVELGSSEGLMPGETLVAIGNPFGLSNTVTTGVVSALHRSVPMPHRVYEDFIQTDAAINPGNSGGALLDIQGKLVGINTVIQGEGSGIGFAIPVDKARAVVEEVMRHGEVRPAYLGLDVDPAANGARVVTVDKGGPAEQAGVRVGDVVVDMSGQQVTDARGFRSLQRALVPGTKVRLGVVREGGAAQLELGVRELTAARATELGKRRLGLTVAPAGELMAISGVLPGSEAARIGLRRGDLLLSLAGRAVRTSADFDRLCAAIREAQAVSMIIGRGKRQYYVTLELR